MHEYLLIFRDHENQWPEFSPAQMQAVSEKFDRWRQSMKDKNAFVAAGKLTHELGTTVRMQDKEIVVDGPFSEAKEAVAGFYLIRAESLEQASKFAKMFPMLEFGGSVEVREMVLVQTE